MRRYVVSRLVAFPVSLLAVATATFLLLAVLPGNLARSIAGPEATAAQVADVGHRLGFDQSVPQRYWSYLGNLLHGRLGDSFYSGQPVGADLASRVPATLELVLPALLFAVLAGIGLGALGASFAGRRADRAVRSLLTLIQSCPDFLLAVLLTLLFFSTLHWLPGPEGQLGFAQDLPTVRTHFIPLDAALDGNWSTVGAAVLHLVLPTVSLGVVYSVAFARTTRAVLASTLRSDYVRFGRACGLSERRLLHYALLGARTTLLTYGAVILAGVIGGDAIVETVFSWDGAGQWAVESMLRLDLPSIQAFVLLTGALTLTVYFSLDILSARLDPRIRFG